ncbi:bifunctional peptidase and arginyl-hydroxylase JMJD5 [Chrysoperla carnea]|uniref:bifunctional peptidase and arginyl-hydroxylase JMJD5 n=1 Tax=Chrysoperla carnea TaxID=189513 RepID=UPI001D071807|nr:bifunctional peptidase and arginyl-hydroxylase JMJD5 [Chrysoperla carnea]
MGLLLGAPIFDENDENILSNMGIDLMKYFNKYIYVSADIEYNNSKIEATSLGQELLNVPENCKEISTCEKPELSYFNDKFFKPCIPVKLIGCIDHWPAKTKWTNLDYFIKIAGERTIPVEIGAHYVHENWTQKLMTMREFIMNYVCKEYDEESQRGYLAQHTLFDQLPQLRDDIIIPDYCALTDDDETNVEPEINAWFGPKGTLSPLHYDPKHNLLTQVIGSKQIILFSPDDSSYLYPYDDKLLFNTSQVDPISPNLKDYPEFGKAIKWYCVLKPGEMLYIPPKWWHHVVSLEKSFSVSFWWR